MAFAFREHLGWLFDYTDTGQVQRSADDFLAGVKHCAVRALLRETVEAGIPQHLSWKKSLEPHVTSGRRLEITTKLSPTNAERCNTGQITDMVRSSRRM